MKKSNVSKGIFIFGAGFAVFFACILLMSNFASAATYAPDIRGIVQGTINIYIDAFEPFLQAIFGGFGWNGLLLFERLLLFVMLVAVIYVLVGNIDAFENQKAVRWIISLVIPLIGIRFINFEWLNAVLLQYTVVFIAIGAILPFLSFFYFVYKIGDDYPMLRKVLWATFIFVYAGMWMTVESSTASEMCFWVFVSGIICLIFDNRIENQLHIREMLKQAATAREVSAAGVSKQIEEIEEHISRGRMNEKVGRKEINRLIKFQTDLRKGTL